MKRPRPRRAGIFSQELIQRHRASRAGAAFPDDNEQELSTMNSAYGPTAKLLRMLRAVVPSALDMRRYRLILAGKSLPLRSVAAKDGDCHNHHPGLVGTVR